MARFIGDPPRAIVHARHPSHIDMAMHARSGVLGSAQQHAIEIIAQHLPPPRIAVERLHARVGTAPLDRVTGRAHDAREIDVVEHADALKQLAATGREGFRQRRSAWRSRQQHHPMTPEGEQACGRGARRSTAQNSNVDIHHQQKLRPCHLIRRACPYHQLTRWPSAIFS